MNGNPLKRARVACVQCREMKRKCDGNNPCDTCGRYGHQCRFAPRNQSEDKSPPAKRIAPPPPPPSLPTKKARQQSMNANSGQGFIRQLVKSIDPVNAPRLRLTAWNCGPRPQLQMPFIATAITDLLTQGQMTMLAEVYFEKVDPCYAFIERDRVFADIDRRWQSAIPPRDLDAMLCGIAALASYFSKAHAVAVEQHLVKLAKTILDDLDISTEPDLYTLTAWVCRVVYMRVAGEPLNAYAVSCSAMHHMEMSGIHLAPRAEKSLFEQPNSIDAPLQIRRRLFGVAQHLNTWISFDVGLSRVSLPAPDIPIVPESRGYSDKLLQLLPAALSLDPMETQDDEMLHSALEIVLGKQDTEGPLVMGQCNLLLTILRRLGNLRSGEDALITPSLKFMEKSLRSARKMTEDDEPWHHLANVPFQIFCMLLAIDTPASLRMVSDAVQTLVTITKSYNTTTLREAANTAYLILSLHKKRRQADAKIMESILATPLDLGVPNGDNTEVFTWPMPNDNEVGWIHTLMAEFPTLQNMDYGDMMSSSFDGDALT